jgi:uncharacterized membrane protein YciS (DUF1049 family)
MRLLCFLFLVAVAAAIVVFVVQNDARLTLTFLNWQIGAPVAAFLGVAYGLGMLTGWSVVGLLRRSFEAATDFRDRREQARVP